VTLLWAGLIVVGVAAVAITAMLLVRRTAPAGSYFEDGDRAAGVFGVLATGFAVLLGFVVFLAFESFDTARTGAEAEAQIVAEQVETAQLFPVAVRGRLSGQLFCYARNVIHQEWPQMQAGTLGDTISPWTVIMFQTLRTVEPRSASEQAAYSKWLDQRTDREDARADRTHGAEGVIPTPLWIVLLLSAAIGIAALLKRNRALALLVAMVVAYFTIISASGGTDIRYAIPMAPMYCLAIAAGVRFRALREKAA
jgi:hypothetical protein